MSSKRKIVHCSRCKYNRSVSFTASAILWLMLSCRWKNAPTPDGQAAIRPDVPPRDSLAAYFPAPDTGASTEADRAQGASQLEMASACLFAFKEPLLFNAPPEGQRFRFTWLRSFHEPMVFNLIGQRGRVMLVTKKIDRIPMLNKLVVPDIPEYIDHYQKQGYTITRRVDTTPWGKIEKVAEIVPDRRADLLYSDTIKLTDIEWTRLAQLMNEAGFWSLPRDQWAGMADGAVWIYEARLENKYHYVVRQSPSGTTGRLGRYLIELSGKKEEIY